MRQNNGLACAFFACLMSSTLVFAESASKESKGAQVRIADGGLQLTAPESWKSQKPRSRIVAHEFSIPAAAGDKSDGRLTIMGAGGSIEANIERWKGQFQPSEDAKVTEKRIAQQKVSLVDISGTYRESVGPPIARKFVERPEYRMLAAIVQTERRGNYFIKLYGPAQTIAASEKQFNEFVESLQATK